MLTKGRHVGARIELTGLQFITVPKHPVIGSYGPRASATTAPPCVNETLKLRQTDI